MRPCSGENRLWVPDTRSAWAEMTRELGNVCWQREQEASPESSATSVTVTATQRALK